MSLPPGEYEIRRYRSPARVLRTVDGPRTGGFLVPVLLPGLLLGVALLVTLAPVARCGLCRGQGECFADEIGGTWVNLACPRCCPHGYIEPGRKVAPIRNWLPGLTPALTRADVEKALRQPEAPSGLRRVRGYR